MRYRRRTYNVSLLLLCGLALASLSVRKSSGQTVPSEGGQRGQSQPTTREQLPPSKQPGVQAPGKTVEGEDKRIFGVLPNYRTAEMKSEYTSISAGRKLTIATKDSFDYPLAILAGLYAGLYQLENNHPEFGQGMRGYAKRLGTSYADQVIGNYLTEGFLPIVFREDPRYFRMSEGPKKKRTLYALTRIFVTHTDSGRTSFNYAEVIGNGMAAGIGLSYYPDSRDAKDFTINWATQLGTDATSQVLKEFWPDVKKWWYFRRHKESANR